MKTSEFLDDKNLKNYRYPLFRKVGATTLEIDEFQSKHNIELPDDIVEFYKISNGIEGDDFFFSAGCTFPHLIITRCCIKSGVFPAGVS
jgi:hypothetical protein